MSKRSFSANGATVTASTSQSQPTKQTTAYLHSLWKRKLTVAEMAACSGLKVSTIEERIKHHRITNGTFAPRHGISVALSMPERKVWRKFWAGGYTYAEMAEMAGQSVKGVTKRLRKLRSVHATWFPKRNEAAA